jgi:hypothetical protein
MASENTPDTAKRLVKALLDKENLNVPLGRIEELAAEIGLPKREVFAAIEYCKAEGWLEPTKMGGAIKWGWLSVTPSGLNSGSLPQSSFQTQSAPSADPAPNLAGDR